MSEKWFPFLVMNGQTRVGVYWAADAKDAAGFARMESRSFGPVNLTRKPLTVTPFTEAQRLGRARELGMAV